MPSGRPYHNKKINGLQLLTSENLQCSMEHIIKHLAAFLYFLLSISASPAAHASRDTVSWWIEAAAPCNFDAYRVWKIWPLWPIICSFDWPFWIMVAALETHAVTPLNKLVQQLPNILAECEESFNHASARGKAIRCAHLSVSLPCGRGW